MKIILNVGAGNHALNREFFLLDMFTLGDYIIYNLDLYNDSYLPIDDIIGSNSEHSNVSEFIDFIDNSADIILSVSPYGYSPINKETWRVLKNGGYFIIMGNYINKYMHQNKQLIESSIQAKIIDSLQFLTSDQWHVYCGNIIHRVFLECKSYKADGVSITPINFIQVIRIKKNY